jgi:hypothetical protein
MTIDMKLTAVFLKVPEGYVGFVESCLGLTLKEPL